MNDPLYGPVHTRTTDPQTSHDAGASIDPSEARTRRYRTLQLIRAHGPISDDDWYDLYVERWPGKYSYSHRSRRTELRDLGFVRDSGMRKKNPSGREAILWEVTEEGRIASDGDVALAWERLRTKRQAASEIAKGAQSGADVEARQALVEIGELTRNAQSPLAQEVRRIVERALALKES